MNLERHTMSYIQADHLVYEYPAKGRSDNTVALPQHAIDDLDLIIERGSFVVIIGRNGSGKSTFARHINALLQPVSGRIIVDGIDTGDSLHTWELRQKIGMVFQNPDNQIIGNTVEEDVAFGPENLGVAPEEIQNRVRESLSIVGMIAYQRTSPHHLSGGQKQRISIAGVLAMRSDCIVLDESTAMLDPEGRSEILEVLRRLNKGEGITVILITHHMEEAANADRVIIFDKGHVAMDGEPRKIFSQVKSLKSFGLDVPQVTELAYELRREGIDIEQGILSVEELVDELCRYA
jgi:energy-coupling factor transporter ATPase